MLRRIAPWLVAGLLVFSVRGAVAQDEADAATYLPDPFGVGDGWQLVAELPPTGTLDPSFRDGAGAVYSGPAGGRVALLVYVVDDGPAAVRQSWTVANEIFDTVRRDIDHEYGREEELAGLPLPDGCADARRVSGVEEVGLAPFPVGLTLCAADPNLILIGWASGSVNDRTESAASDDVVEAALALRSDATPDPTP